MYPHGGSGNHGCEAIVRSTAKLLGNNLTLFTNNVDEDRMAGLDNLCKLNLAGKPIRFGSINYISACFKNRILGEKDAFDRLVFHHVVKAAKEADYVLSIGGDNYCYNTPEFIYLMNQMVDKAGVKRILWGASVDSETIDERMLQDLKGYHLIWARESLTYDGLKAKGLKQTFLFPDPAFILERKDLPLPDGFVEGNTVGINVSPMIIGYEKNRGIVLQNYVNLIKYIIEKTNMCVALVPHVVWKHNDDREPLTQLYNMFKDTNRVVLIENHNSEELKGYIARCRFMVVARTHASIAAYSSQVPTLVIGYSVKARGIAKDIFGTYDKYVISAQSIRKNDELITGFKWLTDHEQEIKKNYHNIIPTYINQVYNICTLL